MIAQDKHAGASAQQQAVMDHALTAPALVDAGAGTGKTFTIVERVAQLNADANAGCPASSILLLTFSKKAAAELRGRIVKRLGPGVEPPECATFHAFALSLLKDMSKRAAYDKMLTQHGSRGAENTLQQRITQRSIAEQNFNRARQLASDNDFYGAIVLLKQAVQFAPDNAQAWYLLGSCQERNPKWRRDAAESFQKALSIEPDNVDILVSLGDLYKVEGMISRAQTCYEDVLRVNPDHAEARSRLGNLKKK